MKLIMETVFRSREEDPNLWLCSRFLFALCKYRRLS
jgi:hypothetical protein